MCFSRPTHSCFNTTVLRTWHDYITGTKTFNKSAAHISTNGSTSSASFTICPNGSTSSASNTATTPYSNVQSYTNLSPTHNTKE